MITPKDVSGKSSSSSKCHSMAWTTNGRRKKRKRTLSRRWKLVQDNLQIIAKWSKDSAKCASDCPGDSGHPKFLRMPRIYSATESKTRTARAIQRIQLSIAKAQKGILVILNQDSSYSSTCRNLLLRANDDDDDIVHDNKQSDEEKKTVDLTPVSKNLDSIALGTDWLQCIPIYPTAPTAMITTPMREKGQLLISIGTFCKFSNIWMKDSMIKTLDEAHDTNNFIAITK